MDVLADPDAVPRGQPQDELDDARLRIVVDQIDDDIAERAQAVGQDLHDQQRGGRVCLQVLGQVGLGQDQHFGRFAGLGMDHASAAAGHLRHAEHVAGEAEPEDDILAFLRRLANLDPALLQEVNVPAGIAGLEDELVAGEQLALTGLDQVPGVGAAQAGQEIRLSRRPAGVPVARFHTASFQYPANPIR